MVNLVTKKIIPNFLGLTIFLSDKFIYWKSLADFIRRTRDVIKKTLYNTTIKPGDATVFQYILFLYIRMPYAVLPVFTRESVASDQE